MQPIDQTTSGPATSVGERPLAGIRVVSVAVNLPGPLAAARLAEFGAEVVKVEPPTGDPLAAAAPQWYAELIAGQRVLTLDLKTGPGQDHLATLLKGADLLLSSLRPSAADRLGLPASAHAAGAVFLEVVGHDGDDADLPGHDLTYQAAAGTLDAPRMPLVPVADLLGGERAVSAALAALRSRDHGGPVTRVRVTLEDAARAAAAPVRRGLLGPGGPLGGDLPTYSLYASADGHVAVAAVEPHFAARLAEHIGSTRDEIARTILTRPGAEWERIANELDLPLAVVRPPR